LRIALGSRVSGVRVSPGPPFSIFRPVEDQVEGLSVSRIEICSIDRAVLATDDPTAEERFQTIPRVEAVTCRDLRFTIRGRGDDLVTEVIHCLSENRIRVTDFRTILPNLEDVFLKLTGHSIRD
jgi:hypothetical protein